MKYIILAFTKLFGFLGKFKSFLPLGIPGLFLVIQFIINGFGKSWTFALSHLSKTIFASELIINQNVHLAIANSPSYNFWVFLEIVLAVYILYNLVRFIGKIFNSINSNYEKYFSGYFIALLFVFVLEVSVIKIVDGSFGFIPLKDGLFFLLINLAPVFTNIFGSSASVVVSNISTNISNNISI